MKCPWMYFQRPKFSIKQAAVLPLVITLFIILQQSSFSVDRLEVEVTCLFRSTTFAECNKMPFNFIDTCKAFTRTLASIRKRRARITPHIIHQSWKNEDVPQHFMKWSQSWKDSHKDWEYKLWTDEDNRMLVEKDYPSFLPVYDSFPENIMRADFCRMLYMHKYGGVYADLDTWCLRDNSNLTDSESVKGKPLLAMMGYNYEFEHNIPNAWMSSPQNHPFWLFTAHLIAGHGSWWLEDKAKRGAEWITGPVVLKHALDTWHCLVPESMHIDVLPPGYIYVLDWKNDADHERFIAACDGDTIDESGGTERCLQEYPNAHVLTFWSHSWG